MKTYHHKAKLFLAGGLAFAIVGCSGGATTAASDTGATHKAPHQQTAQKPAQDYNETAQVQEDMDMDMAAHATASPHVMATPGSKHDHDMAMGDKAMSQLKALSGQEFDIAFMSQMIAHHQGAVDMAKQTLEVAKEPETKQEAQNVIDAQQKEIAQMEGWLQQWYDTKPSQEQQDLMRQDMASMMDMKIQDDHMFYDMMIPHHQGAIDMAKMALDKAQRQELKDLAGKIQQSQTAEIQKYQELANK